MKTRIFGSILLYLVFVSFSWSQYSFDLSCLSDTFQTVAPNGFSTFNFRLANTGSANDVYELNCQIVESVPGWFVSFCVRGRCVEPGIPLYDTLNVGQFDTAIHISVYTTSTTGREILSLNVRSLGDPTQKDSIRVYTQVGQGIEEDRSTHNTLLPTPEIYPNPLKTQTAIRFIRLRRTSRIDLKIYDISGKQVKHLFTSHQSPVTSYCLIWDGRDQNGRPVPNGSYIVSLINGTKIRTSKPMVLIK